MSDVAFVNGLGQSLVLKSGSLAAHVPLEQSSRAGRGRAAMSRILSQGSAANAYAVNFTTGRKSTAYGIVTEAIGGTAGIARADFLTALLVTRDSQGNLAQCDTKFATQVYSLASDQCKAFSFNMDINAAADMPVMLNLALMGLSTVSGATFPSYVAQTGAPAESRLTTFSFAGSSATEIERCVISDVPGGRYGSWADGLSVPSNIDPGVLTGGVVVRQRAGATNRLDAADSGTLVVTLNTGLVTTLQLERSGDGVTTDFGGGLCVESTWFFQSLDGNSPIAFS